MPAISRTCVCARKTTPGRVSNPPRIVSQRLDTAPRRAIPSNRGRDAGRGALSLGRAVPTAPLPRSIVVPREPRAGGRADSRRRHRGALAQSSGDRADDHHPRRGRALCRGPRGTLRCDGLCLARPDAAALLDRAGTVRRLRPAGPRRESPAGRRWHAVSSSASAGVFRNGPAPPSPQPKTATR